MTRDTPSRVILMVAGLYGGFVAAVLIFLALWSLAI